MSDEWTEAQISHLKERWAAGARTSTIAMEIGKSKNAVAGKVHRLGLPAPVIKEPFQRGGRPRKETPPDRQGTEIAPEPDPDPVEAAASGTAPDAAAPHYLAADAPLTIQASSPYVPSVDAPPAAGLAAVYRVEYMGDDDQPIRTLIYPPPLPADLEAKQVTIWHLRPHHCKNVVGQQHSGGVYCGNDVRGRPPWCPICRRRLGIAG